LGEVQVLQLGAPKRTIEIFRYKDRFETEVLETLEAENLPAALSRYYLGTLFPQGYRMPLRTGNVLTIKDAEGNEHEFAARDAS
jgi:hypothetical protein